MTEPYLILHKVRGEPAFDIATKLEAPDNSNGANEGATETWWIIPTSGHRAYPVWAKVLAEVDFMNRPHPNALVEDFKSHGGFVPVPDHYRAAEPPPSRPRHVPVTTTEDFLL